MKPPSDEPERRPHLSTAAREAAAARRAREAEALRANLLRRKQQSRARTAPEPSPPSAGSESDPP